MSLLLNAPQREAIHYLDGPCLVLAGAGSGKTRVITQKIAYLINDCGFNPCNIAAITFTNKSAKEMRERVAKHLYGAEADAKEAAALWMGTFHSICAKLLRRHADQIMIVKRNVKPFCQSISYFMPAASELPSDRDNRVFHHMCHSSLRIAVLIYSSITLFPGYE